MSVAGEWCSVWNKHGEPLNRREEITGIHLTGDDNAITGSFRWRNAEYRLSGRLVSSIFLQGRMRTCAEGVVLPVHSNSLFTQHSRQWEESGSDLTCGIVCYLAHGTGADPTQITTPSSDGEIHTFSATRTNRHQLQTTLKLFCVDGIA